LQGKPSCRCRQGVKGNHHLSDAAAMGAANPWYRSRQQRLTRGRTISLLHGHVKVHRIRVLPSGADINVSQAREHEVRVRETDHKLFRGYKNRKLGCAVPKGDGIGAEIVTIDGHREGHAVHRHAVWCQRRNRGWRKRDDTARIMISRAHSASEGKQTCQKQTDVPHNYLLQV